MVGIDSVLGNYTSPASAISSIGISAPALLVIIALFLTFRIYRSMTGTKYSTINVYRAPVVYLALTLISLAFLSASYTDIIVVFAVIILGCLVGLKLAAGLQFYEKNNTTYYKRSPFIMIVWLVSFIARFAVDFFIPTSFIISFVVEIVLAGTTGMILGEAAHITKRFKLYKKPAASSQA